MSKPCDTPGSLLHRIGVAGPARSRAFKGTSAPICLLLALGVLAFAATPAFAGRQYISGSSFGVKGVGAGQLEDPEGIAVNNEAGSASEGDVYVADTGNRRIDEFTAAGDFVMAFGKNVGGLGEDTCTVTCVAGESGTEPGAFTNPRFIAVDQTTGDLYVADTGDNLITKFSESGAYQAQLTGTCEKETESPPACTGSKFVPFGALNGIAVDPAGGLWVLTSGSAAEFSDTGVFDKTFPTRSAYGGLAVDASGGVYVDGINLAAKYESGLLVSEFSHIATALAVNPATNTVLVFQTEYFDAGQLSNDIELFPPFAEPSAPIETFTAEGLSGSNGIAVNGAVADYPLYVTQPSTDTVVTYDYLQLPEVSSVPASSVGIKQEAGHPVVGATLNGTVDPNEVPVSACEFEYGTTTAYGKTVPCETEHGEPIGEGTAPVPVHADLTNLLPSTTYHFRLRAANANDGSDPEVQIRHAADDETFLTSGPTIVSEEAPAAEVTGNTATLSGVVNPGGLPLSKCEIEYGTKAELKASGLYEGSVPCAPDAAEIGSGTAPVTVHADLEGLVGGTSYSFRLVVSTEVLATKQKVTVAGAGRELTTEPTPVIAAAEAPLTGMTLNPAGELSAELRATVNPEGLQVSHCAFEYGTSTSYGLVVRCAQKKSAIGYGTEPVPVSAQLSELMPNTTYYWRLSVRDGNGEGYEPGHTFVYPTAGAELPDNRAYEMVTPPFKGGGLIGDVFISVEPAFSEGPEGLHKGPSRVIAPTIQCFAPSESCTADRQTEGEPFEFTRTPTGWVTTALAPPATRFSENSAWLVSADEGTALFSMPPGPAEGDSWYARSPEGSFSQIGPATPPGITRIQPFKIPVKKSTADLSHLVWNEEVDVYGQPWPFDKTTGSTSLYEYVGTHNPEPFLVGVTGGEYNANSSERNNELISTCTTLLGSTGSGSQVSYRGALSGDGRTVYFAGMACPGGTGTNAGKAVPVEELYARVDGELPDAHTVAISEPQALAPGVRAECESEECKEHTSVANEHTYWRNATFRGASEDGSRMFFTSE